MSQQALTVYTIEPHADWVKLYEVPTIEHTGDSPFAYPLVDYQEQIFDNEIHSYRNTYQCIYDASRVEDASLYITELHQGSQRLVVHELSIIRNGESINALDTENISVIQRERSLESHIVDNSITVSISVDDLREGDHIQFRSTVIETANEHPFHGRFFSSNYPLSWGCPVSLQAVRVLNRGSKPLRSLEGKLVDGKQEYVKTEIKPGDTSELTYRNLGNESIPESAPSWVWGSFIQISSKAEWPELSQYLYRYYKTNGALEQIGLDELNALDIYQADDSAEKKALAVIRFVQNSIRYRGENHGVFTHTPKSPARTLKKRAGDCKDKSNLMVAMLSALGIDARMVLVHSNQGKKTAELNPSPYHFNHMIVEVQTQDKAHYVDATIKKQYGDFSHLGQLDYGFGLPLSETNNAPVEIVRSVSNPVFKLTHELNFPRDASKHTLKIERCYALHRADNMRAYFSSNEKSRYQQDFLEWAKGDTGLDLETVSAIEVSSDDLINNTLVANEEYKIVDINRSHKNRLVKITTDFYRDLPVSDNESFAVRIDLDGEVKHEIIANYDTLPELHTDQKNIKTDSFIYQDKVNSNGKTIFFLTKLKPLSTYVKAGKAAKIHRENVEALFQRSTSLIPHKNPNRFLSGFEKLLSNGVLLAIAAFVVVAIYSWLKQL